MASGVEQPTRCSEMPAGRPPDWLKMKNPACEAMRREAEEELGPMTYLAAAALIGATIGMAIAIALAGIVAGMAIDEWWHRRRER
jgi:hypothetical protein